MEANELFGRVRKGRIKATGGHVPEYDRLKEALDGRGCVIHMFCIGCGLYYQATQRQAEKFASKADVGLPDNLVDYYIQVTGCDVCDGDHDRVMIRPIN